MIYIRSELRPKMVQAILLKKRPLYLRWDVIPFVIIFPLIISPARARIMEAYNPNEPDWPSNSTFAFIFDHVDVPTLEPHAFIVTLPVFVALFAVILWLIPYWSVKIKAKVHYMKSTELEATHVAFYPARHHGSPGIVPLIREKGKAPYTLFQQKKRELIDGEWKSLKYPTNLMVSEYLSNKGLSDAEAAQRLFIYGQNTYTVPIPSFMELYKDHIRSPMFVFQVFSILCYLLDEYWTYPLFNLVSLLFMEGTTVRTRQNNMLELRGAETPPVSLFVKRSGKWNKTTSDCVVPGDIVLIDKEILCPCDLLVMSGRAVVNEAMLTGESTPQVKDPATSLPKDRKLDPIEKDRRCVMFGGTTVEQILPDGDCAGLPAQGVVCQVLSTGLGSTQGKLIRTIMFSSERFSVESKDSFYLLLFLSIFAIIASGYVCYKGKEAGTISTFRLMLETILILTMTIPPDLPMQLNFSVNTSLLGLSKLKVFCTEPYRIPFAGMISVCCFDKTGTLTAEEYKMVGVDDMNDAPASKKNAEIVGNYHIDHHTMPIWPLRIIGGCHSLVRGSYGQLVGDSLEATAFSTMKYKLTSEGSAEHPRGKITPIKAYHFASELRRMSVVCSIEGEQNLYALMKGAPEAIGELLEEVPANYYETNRKYTRQGCRVLALAYREMGTEFNPHTERNIVEQKMKFAGFIIFSAAIKRGSEDTIVELLRSNHRCIIITGDDPLTACHVAQCLHMTKKKPAIHDVKITDENGKEISDDEGYELCYTGKAIENADEEEFEHAVRNCNIFARMSPSLKAKIVIKLQSLGFKVLMCGDGTNDVNALKQASVGIGLVEQADETKESQVNEEAGVPKLGAASIASPFVSKRPTISACVDIIRFGRSTLSSTLDLFKQLSLNCLISAYTMSVLYIENVRFGERQLTIFSIVMSIAAMSISWAVPRRTLSTERPFPGQFNAYLVCSVLAQFGIHFFFLYKTHQLVFDNGFKIDRFNTHARFTPSLLNTAMFILKSEMELITICVNYRGKPFMQSFSENRMLLVGIILSIAIIAVLILDIHPWIRKQFQLVEYPNKKFQYLLGMYCALDAFLSFFSEWACMKWFTRANRKASEGLVDDEIKEDLESYDSNEDDILPEEAHDFGLMELMKSNVEMQKTIRDKTRANAVNERKKMEMANKARKEAEKYIAQGK